MATADDRDDDIDRPAARRRRDDDRPHYEEPHRGVLILVLGILGLVACAVLGPIAWIMGNTDLKKMDAGVMDPEGRSNTQIGKILGIVGTVLLGISLVGTVLWIAVVGIFVATAQPANAPVQQAPVFKAK